MVFSLDDCLLKMLRMCPGNVCGNIQTFENVKCKLGRLPRTATMRASGNFCLCMEYTARRKLSYNNELFLLIAKEFLFFCTTFSTICSIFTCDTFPVSDLPRSCHLAVSPCPRTCRLLPRGVWMGQSHRTEGTF